MSCIRCRGFLVMEASRQLDRKGVQTPPTVRCVNCGYIDDPVFRVNRLNFNMVRILDDDIDFRAARLPKKQHLARAS